MAGLGSIANLARIARVVALLLFLTPWMSVSCSTHGLDQLADLGPSPVSSGDVPIARATGLQLATGSVSYADAAPLSSAMNEVSNLFEKPNPAVVGAALLILLSLAASFVLNDAKGAIFGIAATALAAAALWYGVAVEIPSKAEALFHRLGGHRMGVEIHANVQIGFWLCVAALLAAIGLDALALRRTGGPAAPSPPAG
jgi:hypothetical protein